ncbi:hypothetical protein BJV77DRAFT_633381 [Russula vinacea]|nr:hypothetical protein BJV77DRAFT_633381 [Russula vinacea]
MTFLPFLRLSGQRGYQREPGQFHLAIFALKPMTTTLNHCGKWIQFPIYGQRTPRWFPQYLRPSTQQLVSRGPPDKFSTFIFVSKNLWESDGYESDSDSEDSELDEAHLIKLPDSPV